MNNVPQDQLLEKQLDRLAAQRQLYSCAKQVLALQMASTVLIPVAWALLAIWVPAVKPYSALWGLAALGLDIAFLSGWQRRSKLAAARIQELFDCDVLQMEWNRLRAGSPPGDEIVTELALKYVRVDPGCSQLREWYCRDVGALPLELGRLACQKSNCWWDSKLRIRYATAVGAALGLLLLLLVLIAMIGGWTTSNFVLVALFPWLPALSLGTRQILDNHHAAGHLDRLKTHADSVWHDALSGDVPAAGLAQASRQLQDEIFLSRSTSPLIPDIVYRRLKREYEEQMNVGCRKLVQEALEKLGV